MMTLIDRLVAIKQEAANRLPHGASLSDAQQAEILIAQVQEILAGEIGDPEPDPTKGAVE